MKNGIVVGFSANPEISFGYVDLPGEKGSLDSFTVSLSGSSVNVAMALKRLGHDPLLLVPSEVGESDVGHLLEMTLRRSELSHVRLDVLEHTPLAIYPISEQRKGCLLYRRKGVLSTDTRRLEQAIAEIKGYNGLWRFATGIDLELAPLAWHLLGEEKAFRVLKPSLSLCCYSGFKDFSLPMSPLSRCDLLVLNMLEFEALGRCNASIHELGVSLIVVTDGERGGSFSLCNEATNGQDRSGSFQAARHSTQVFLVGAGDWFLGGLAAYIMEVATKVSLATMSFDVIQAACNFGAKVAGLKITMRGGGSTGPTRTDLQREEGP